MSPYDWKTKNLKVRDERTNDVIATFDVRIRKTSVRVPCNGYSAWNGWKNVDKYEAQFEFEGETITVSDDRRKDAIHECVLQYASMSGVTPTDRRHLNSKGE